MRPGPLADLGHIYHATGGTGEGWQRWPQFHDVFPPGCAPSGGPKHTSPLIT
jgi:hypothetical protein